MTPRAANARALWDATVSVRDGMQLVLVTDLDEYGCPFWRAYAHDLGRHACCGVGNNPTEAIMSFTCDLRRLIKSTYDPPSYGALTPARVLRDVTGEFRCVGCGARVPIGDRTPPEEQRKAFASAHGRLCGAAK